jgi:uncharacterized membrane protein
MEPENNISTGDNGKTVAIISYLSFIGWLISFFAMHKDNKTELGSYHLRQTLLFYIVYIGFYILWSALIVPLLFTSLAMITLAATLIWVVNIAFIVFWVIGFIGAVNGEKKPIPLIGDKAQTMFSTI